MIHLLANLMRYHEPRALALLLLETLVGSLVTVRLLAFRKMGRWPDLCLVTLTGVLIAGASWVVFLTGLAGTYPQLSLAVPRSWAIPAIATSFSTAIMVTLIHRHGQRSARNAMLGGSLLACGLSCMLFTGMAGVVRPFALSYDLTAVLVTTIVGSALYGFSSWELSNTHRRHRWTASTGLATLATLDLVLGSLASILPFGDWLTAVSRTDDLTSSPIVIIVWVEAMTVLVLGLFGSLVDNRAAARERQEIDRFRQLADSALEGILIHRDGDILDCNRSLAGLLGIGLAELRSGRIDRFIPAGADSALWSVDQGSLAETDILAADGSRLPVEILSREILYRGSPAHVTAIRDVRERRASEERIRFLAHHDLLTGLPNRVRLNESLDLALRLAGRMRAPLAVLCLDLDGFKLVNDTLGHAAGDELLRQVAIRLRASMRDGDLVARVGGDEFVVLQTSGAQPAQSVNLARRLVECLSASFLIDGQEVAVGTSIGIAIHPQDGDTATLLLKRADVALYRAKQSGRGWFCLFEIGMDLAVRERRAMEQDLRAAVHRHDLTLDFQPIFDRNRNLIAFEALARWNHPTEGPISPAQFIPLAEECGLIVPIGEWVLRTACHAVMTWSGTCGVAVNLSPAQFLRGNLRATVESVLAETGLDPGRLELEITEGVLITNAQAALDVLKDLRGLGVSLVLDDFGTGYSSLSYLHRFPFDKLKIDRSFVQRLEIDMSSHAIVNAIISMSRNLNLKVTAEGVETVGQFTLLCAQGCDELQGFLLGRPMPQEAIPGFIEAYTQDRSRRPAEPIVDALEIV